MDQRTPQALHDPRATAARDVYVSGVKALDVRVALAFALVYLIWGSTYLAIRVVVASIPPAASAGVRFTIAGALMLAFARLTGRGIAVSRRDAMSLAIVGFFLLVCGNGLVVWSEQYVASGLAALMVATMPLWLAILSAALPHGERLPPMGWVGVVLGFTGLATLLWPKVSSGLSSDLAGEAALLLAPLCWSVGSLYSKRRPVTVTPLIATGWEMLFGGTVLSAIAAASGEFSRFSPTQHGWLALAYLVIFGSCVAFTAFVWLLQRVPAAKVATYAYVNPVIAVLLGWVLLDEPLTSSMLAGTAIIVGAVALVITARMRTTQPVLAEQPVESAVVQHRAV
jgi:drug/metabolite transporter (DMT)-like permease